MTEAWIILRILGAFVGLTLILALLGVAMFWFMVGLDEILRKHG